MTPRRAAALVLAALATVIPAVPAVAAPAAPAPASSAPASSAPASSAPALDVSGVQSGPGEVSFALSGRGLPAGVTLDQAKIRVEADTVPLRTTRGSPTTFSVSVRVVVLVMDASGSMRADLPQAKAATRRYVQAAPAGVWFGLVAIADEAKVLLKPTADRAAFTTALGTLRPGGGTPLYDGIGLAVDLAGDANAPTAGGFLDPQIVVLSDGIDNQSNREAIRAVHTALREAGIVTSAILYGADADRPQLQSVVTRSGGTALKAADAEQLGAGFRDVTAAQTEPLTVRAVVPPGLRGGETTLRVTAGLTDGTVLRTTETVTLPVAAPAAPPPARSTVVPPALDRWRLLAAIAAALTVLLASFAVLDTTFGRTSVQRRLDSLRRFAVSRRPTRRGAKAELRADLAALGERIAAVTRAGRGSDVLLDRAAVGIRPPEWLVIRLAATTAGAALGVLALPWWLGLPAGAAGGWLLPDVVLRRRISRRARAFADELPEALHLIVSSLRAGFTLQHAIEATVRDGEGPAAAELRRAVSETQMGGELEESLERLGHRTGSADVAWLVMAIRLQREVGGNLAEVLQTTADTMRERAYLRRQVRSLSAEGRLSAYILLALPLALGAMMAVTRPDYLRPLYSEPVGIMMLVAAVVMMLVGGLWLRAAVRVEV